MTSKKELELKEELIKLKKQMLELEHKYKMKKLEHEKEFDNKFSNMFDEFFENY